MSFDNPSTATQAFAIMTFALMIKMFLSGIVQFNKSMAAGTHTDSVGNTAPYDIVENDSLQKVEREELLKAEKRWRGVMQNDSETIPLAIGTFLGALLVGGDETALTLEMFIYIAARYGHTLCYGLNLQPYRSLMFLCGQLCVIAGGITGVIAYAF